MGIPCVYLCCDGNCYVLKPGQFEAPGGYSTVFCSVQDHKPNDIFQNFVDSSFNVQKIRIKIRESCVSGAPFPNNIVFKT